MTWHEVNIIFGNSSIAGLITVVTGSVIGVYTFWKQRRQTKIENLSENIELVLDKCEQVNITLDKISSTYVLVQKKQLEKQHIENFMKWTKEAITEVGHIVNDELPVLRAKIKNYCGLYFTSNDLTISTMIAFFEALKEWHQKVIDIAIDGYDFTKKIQDNSDFSLTKIQNTAKNFSDSLK